MPQLSAETDNLVLTAAPEKVEETVVFAYSVVNAGRIDAYVFDALALDDPATREPRLDPDAVTVWRSQDGYAHVLKGIAPLPTDSDVWRSLNPLALLVPPGGRIDRRLVLPLPLAEQSPYFPLAGLRQYRLTDIEGVRLLGFLANRIW